MKNTHVYVVYRNQIYKATITSRGYLVGELNGMILPFPRKQVISLAA